MSRLNWTDDEEYPGQFALWQANVRRSLQGVRGQAAVRALGAALDAMPVKALADRVFVEPSGAMCALGAVAVHQKVTAGLSYDEALAVCADVDPDDSVEAGERAGFPRLVAWAVVALNDIELEHRWLTAEGPSPYPGGYAGYGIWVPITPEERWTAVRAWVRCQLGETTEETT